MAATNITIDDTSPLIQYVPEGSWTHSSGSDAQAYVNQTFSSTTVEGATASVTFNGTGYWLFGAKKPSYGQLIVLCDDRVVAYPNATAPQDEFGQMLGGESGLEDRQHTITFMSAGEMDIDAIMLETTSQESQQEFSSIATVLNAVAVSTATSSSATAASTGRLSANPNAAPPDNQDNGSNGTPPPTNGQNRGAPAQPNVSSSSTDSVASTSTVSSTSAVQSSPVPSSTNGASNQATSSSAKSGLSKGAMIGIAVGAAISILLLLLLLFFILRRRRSRVRAQQMAALQSPALPLQDPDPERASSFFAGRGSYFFTGFGSGGGNNSGRNSAGAGGGGNSAGAGNGGGGGGGGMTDADRAEYLARGPSMRSAGGFPSMPPPPAHARNLSGLPEEDEMALARGFAEQGGPTLRFVDVPLAAPAAAVTTPAGARQSAHSLQASVYGVAYGGSDRSSVYSHSSYTQSSMPRPLTPSRPNRPPDLQL